MSETKLNPILRELARCVAGVEREKGTWSHPFFSAFSAKPIAILCERKPAFVISIQCLYWQRNACDRASNHMRTGCCGGRRFSLASAHCPQRPGAVTHVRKTRVSCSLSVPRRVAGELASNRARSVRCDGVSTLPHSHSDRTRRFTWKIYRYTSLTTRMRSLVARAWTAIKNLWVERSYSNADTAIVTRRYEAYRLTTSHNSNRQPNHRLFFC